MVKKIISAENGYRELDQWIEDKKINNLMLVCDTSLRFMKIKDYFDALEKRTNIVRFDNFQPNPLYESVSKGVKLFREKNCSAIIAVGGGSAMDVAKCIKLYSNLEGTGEDGTWLKSQIIPNTILYLLWPQQLGLEVKLLVTQ